MCTYFKTEHRIHPHREDDKKSGPGRALLLVHNKIYIMWYRILPMARYS